MRDRLLTYSFIISLIVNFLWIVGVGNSDIFQESVTRNQLRVEHLHLVRPPIKKIPPKKKPPPPPPPKPTKLPPPPKNPPPPTPRQTVQRQAPTPTTAVLTSTPLPAAPNGNETLPQPAQISAPPAAPTPAPPTPAPVVAPPPAPIAPPAPPPAPVKPKFPDRAEAIAVTDFNANIATGIDVDLSTLSSTTVIVRYDIGADGKAFNFKIIKSSGDDDLDNAAINECRRVRYLPAVQGGEPIVSRFTHEFDLSN